VICVDEMGPLAVKTYPGEEWKAGPNRATFEPDYGRRGKLWVHGAFEPASGEAIILTSPARDSASHVQVLEKMMTAFPADRWLVIEDNLTIHLSRQVKLALAAWPRDAAMDIPEREVTLNAVSRSLAGLHERIRIPTNSSVMSVAVSHDGARVLTGSLDWTARLWDAATGEEIRAFSAGRPPPARIVAVNGVRERQFHRLRERDPPVPRRQPLGDEDAQPGPLQRPGHLVAG